ncbi:Hypothetical_protein [Hexamita inflata]|uniref:Hypothetical_protein n=1 Tax=Hexamita inflata TaxID=28002 RepID=A0AA86PHD5_9EUKA|nr:Hypothetical protein HINF_LOCUS26233 [Hexamita inflata]
MLQPALKQRYICNLLNTQLQKYALQQMNSVEYSNEQASNQYEEEIENIPFDQGKNIIELNKGIITSSSSRIFDDIISNPLNNSYNQIITNSNSVNDWQLKELNIDWKIEQEYDLFDDL